MTDQLDARIRADVRELVDASHAAPPFEDIEIGLRTPVTRPAHDASHASRRCDRGLLSSSRS